MDDIDGKVDCISESNDSVSGFSLDLIRSGECVAFRACHTLTKQAFLVVLNQVSIFSMHHDHSSKLLASLKDLKHSFIILEEGTALVSSEELE